jgi:hypothetical protein
MSDAEKPIVFGFLPLKWTIEFDIGKIVPIAAFDAVLKSVNRRLHKDGYLYPPMTKTVITDMAGKYVRTVPKTKRPAHLHPVPPSHELSLSLRTADANVREGTAGFVIHYLALLLDTRLQFADWRFDGRIPMRRIGALIYDPLGAGKELSLAYGAWSKWPEAEQRRFVTLLYMHSRAAVYQWDWEEFTIRYMVLDSCWKMAEQLFGLKAKKHTDRISVLCRFLSVDLNNQFINVEKMSELRNDLFHEALWQRSRPGSGSNLALMYGGEYPPRMKVLTEQLILALIVKSQE